MFAEPENGLSWLDARQPSPRRDDVALLALNNLHAVETSLLDLERLQVLCAMAFRATVVLPDAALLLAFDETAVYDSANYLWFRDRLARFIYVDRIVVARAYRRQSLARRLYESLFVAARGAGHDAIVCEINVEPPNPASEAFHESLGFTEVGRRTVSESKTVRYMSRKL